MRNRGFVTEDFRKRATRRSLVRGMRRRPRASPHRASAAVRPSTHAKQSTTELGAPLSLAMRRSACTLLGILSLACNEHVPAVTTSQASPPPRPPIDLGHRQRRLVAGTWPQEPPPSPHSLLRWTGRSQGSSCEVEVTLATDAVYRFPGWLSAHRTLLGELADESRRPPADEETARARLCGPGRCAGEPPWLLSTGHNQARDYHLLVAASSDAFVVYPHVVFADYGRCADPVDGRQTPEGFTLSATASMLEHSRSGDWCWTRAATTWAFTVSEEELFVVRATSLREGPDPGVDLRPPPISLRSTRKGHAVSACGRQQLVRRTEVNAPP